MGDYSPITPDKVSAEASEFLTCDFSKSWARENFGGLHESILVRKLNSQVAPHRDGRTEQADEHTDEHERAVRGEIDLRGDHEAHPAE